jgi:recombination protein RecT
MTTPTATQPQPDPTPEQRAADQRIIAERMPPQASAPQQGSLSPARKTFEDARRIIQSQSEDGLQDALPKGWTVDRVAMNLRLAIASDARLIGASASSLAIAAMEAARLGLALTGPVGEAYLQNRKGKAVFMVGYKGYLKLARNSGEITSIEAHVVCEGDTFDYAFGIDPVLTHKPGPKRGAMTFVYAIARFRTPGQKGLTVQFDVMAAEDVNKIRDREDRSDKSPWASDYFEMAKKTVTKRLCKYLPSASERLERAVAADAASEEIVELGERDIKRGPVRAVESDGSDGMDDAF